MNDAECVAVNSLGFFKHKLELLQPSQYLSRPCDGIYVKVSFLMQLFETNPLLARTIETLCTKLSVSINIEPSVTSTCFWLSPMQAHLQKMHADKLESIARAHSGTHCLKFVSWQEQRILFDAAKCAKNILYAGLDDGLSCLFMLLAGHECKISLVDTSVNECVRACVGYLCM